MWNGTYGTDAPFGKLRQALSVAFDFALADFESATKRIVIPTGAGGVSEGAARNLLFACATTFLPTQPPSASETVEERRFSAA